MLLLLVKKPSSRTVSIRLLFQPFLNCLTLKFLSSILDNPMSMKPWVPAKPAFESESSNKSVSALIKACEKSIHMFAIQDPFLNFRYLYPQFGNPQVYWVSTTEWAYLSFLLWFRYSYPSWCSIHVFPIGGTIMPKALGFFNLYKICTSCSYSKYDSK